MRHGTKNLQYSNLYAQNTWTILIAIYMPSFLDQLADK